MAWSCTRSCKLTAQQIYNYLWTSRHTHLVALKAYLAKAQQLTDVDLDFLKGDFFSQKIINFIKSSRDEILKGGKATRADGHHLMSLPGMADISTEELIGIQSSFLGMVQYSFLHTSFPWLDIKNVKKPQTLFKKLVAMFPSDAARKPLLMADLVWEVREYLTQILSKWATKKHSEPWTWPDCLDDQPAQPEGEFTLEEQNGPFELREEETIANQSVRLATYMELQSNNHKKMQHIADLALSEGLGVGMDNTAIPEVRDALEEFLNVSVFIVS